MQKLGALIAAVLAVLVCLGAPARATARCSAPGVQEAAQDGVAQPARAQAPTPGREGRSAGPAAAPERVPGPLEVAARALEEGSAAQAARIARLERELAVAIAKSRRFEAWARKQLERQRDPGGDPGGEEPPPPDPPTRPPTRPPTEPPPPEPPPSETRQRASWHIELRDGRTVIGAANAVMRQIGVHRVPVVDAQVGPLWLTVVWDDFDGARGGAMQPTPTAFLKFSQGGKDPIKLSDDRGGVAPVFWKSLEVRADGEQLILEQRGLIYPRRAIVRSKLALEHWKLYPDGAPIPQWARVQALAEIAASKTADVGPFDLFVRDPDFMAPAGRAIGPYHGGGRDWLQCAEGYAYRWEETKDAAVRGLWLQNRDGSEWMPGPYGIWYWWQAAAVEYAPSEFRWEWSNEHNAWVPWAYTAADEGVTAMDHGSRYYAGAMALARKAAAAALVARESALEVMRAYSMDERVPRTNPATTDDEGYASLLELLDLTAPGGKYAPPKWSGYGDRRLAHAIRSLAEASAAGVLTDEEADLYLPAIAQLALQLDDGMGRLDRSFQGDVTGAGIPAPACMFFQQALICDALRFLADELELRGYVELAQKARACANRIATWWTAVPAYYASVGGTHRSSILAPHAGMIGHNYALFTVPGTWRGDNGHNYGSFAGVAAASKGHNLGEVIVSYVPEVHRVWVSAN